MGCCGMRLDKQFEKKKTKSNKILQKLHATFLVKY